MRVSPPKVFPEAGGAPRPAAGAPGADAHRQTGFVLGEEVEHILKGLNMEGAIAAASSGAKYRTQVTASVMATWSRSWLARIEALHATQCGNYAAAVPLIRSAADFQAAAAALLGPDRAEWQGWIDGGGIAAAHDLQAVKFDLHAFRSAETIAARTALRIVYERASALAMPHFGATLLLAGADSSPERVSVTFGDREFHVGLAELMLGQLVILGMDQLEVLQGPAFAVEDRISEILSWNVRAGADIWNRGDRCRMRSVEVDGEARFLVENWRRTPGAAPKRILL